VRVSNLITEHDKMSKERIQTADIQALIWECSNKFLLRRNVSIQSRAYKLLNLMNSDP
jgi:hypothetical protein